MQKRIHLTISRVVALAAFSVVNLLPSSSLAAEIVLEQTAVLKLIQQTLFKREGKLDLKTGACYAYLETPSVELRGGRIVIRSHLSSRSGIDVGGSCLGVGLSSWVEVSGAPAPLDGAVKLDGIRIDRVDDAPTRLLLESGLIPKLPSAVELDVRRAVREMLNGITGPVQASLDEFAISSVESEANRLTVRFNFRLVGR